MATGDELDHRRQVRAWILYDWANSAFTTTVIAAVLPVYYANVAGATLPSAARATQAFSLTTSIALLISALVSPLLGAYADLAAAKKRLLGAFVGIGAIATAALVLVGEGDWLLASALFVLGRLGWGTANVMYDALLPHVAAADEQDRVSSQGYALGYLGGGLLLAANVAMILALPDDSMGARLSFLSVAIWWVAFSVPILRRVPEPAPNPTAVALGTGFAALRASFGQVRQMLSDLRRFVQLRRFLIAYLVYNDAINVVIGVAVIYGAELGFGSTELLLAILLVQFTGVPYSLLFGRLPSDANPRRRARVLAFLALNIVAIPMLGVLGRVVLPDDVAGARPAEPAGFEVGIQPLAPASPVPGELDEPFDPSLVEGEPGSYALGTPGSYSWFGQDIELGYLAQPGGGRFTVAVDGQPLEDVGDDGVVATDGPARRFGDTIRLAATRPGPHVVTVTTAPDEVAGPVILTHVEVLPLRRIAALGTILGLLVGLQLLVGAVAFVAGPVLLRRSAQRIDARGAVLLALTAYFVIAVWGFALDAVIEFWALAWLVSVVQGGSQALSRSIYVALVPDHRSAEFFGLFSILAKFASFISPLLFVVSVALFDSSRPAVLSLGVMFALGMALLRRVDVASGRAVAEAADVAATLGGASGGLQ